MLDEPHLCVVVCVIVQSDLITAALFIGQSGLITAALFTLFTVDKPDIRMCRESEE